ncbi:SH3 domain-containing protein [Okeania sp.]|uniref:SH3 domain-containing protein n=1 Tax=Okeania sp. TaxID=3100323 RepID=UPI002B4B8B9A|nr:SH3 domain-containing protein [Okeania sp.]MEB3339573.1 SH3 domain-containing protein [Okeania sp.]
MNFYGFFKFLVGFILAILLLAGASAAAVLYFAAKLTKMPERPIFQNDKPIVQKASTSPKPTPTNNTKSKKQLDPGTYRATVVEPIGLILRDTPSKNANRIGGVSYQEKVIVLEESSDKKWQKVRVDDDSNRTGWVSGGNTEKLN